MTPHRLCNTTQIVSSVTSEYKKGWDSISNTTFSTFKINVPSTKQNVWLFQRFLETGKWSLFGHVVIISKKLSGTASSAYNNHQHLNLLQKELLRRFHEVFNFSACFYSVIWKTCKFQLQFTVIEQLLNSNEKKVVLKITFSWWDWKHTKL